MYDFYASNLDIQKHIDSHSFEDLIARISKQLVFFYKTGGVLARGGTLATGEEEELSGGRRGGRNEEQGVPDTSISEHEPRTTPYIFGTERSCYDRSRTTRE